MASRGGRGGGRGGVVGGIGRGGSEECIYDLNFVVPVEEPKPPRYQSIHDPLVPPTATTFARQGSEKAKVGNLSASSSSSRGHRRAPSAGCKPPLPSRSHKPIFNLSASKDFVTANAVSVILAEPRRPAPQPALGKDPLDAPLEKENFGRVPPYLAEIKCKIKAEETLIRNLQRVSNQTQNATMPNHCSH
eukprot:GHVT01084973.1.p1 GENE.GHVT01084973.1~~GHVT01084973.1.p1  ORF type:complete len:190 (+),score=46.86 GHVT01084973.1:454-1023(+)